MSSDVPAPGSTAEPGADATRDPASSTGPELSSFWSLLGRGSWVGGVTGVVAGPALWIGLLAYSAVVSATTGAGFDEGNDDASAGTFFGTLWLVVGGSLPLAAIGALLGAFAGLIVAGTIAGLLRFEAWAGWLGGNTFLAVAGGIGGLIATVILLPILEFGMPGAAGVIGIAGFIAPAMAIACALVTFTQRARIAPLRNS